MTAALKHLAETVEELPAKDRVFLAERLLISLEDAEMPTLSSIGPTKPFVGAMKFDPAK